MRVLICGRPREPHVRELAKALSTLGVQFSVLDPREFPRRLSLSIEVVDSQIALQLAGKRVERYDIGIDLSNDSHQISSAVDGGARRFAQVSAHETWRAFLYYAARHWLNGCTVPGADNKLVQMEYAHAVGLSTVPTLLSNSIETVRTFGGEHPDLAVKAPAGRAGLRPEQRLYTVRVSASEIPEAEVVVAPAIYQPYVEKHVEYRVTVVGDKVVAVEIQSQDHKESTVDWRHQDAPPLQYHARVLPDALTRKCVQLAQTMRFDYAGIDLIEDSAGMMWFLEINSNPAWLWLEKRAGVPLTEMLARLLLQRARSS